MKQKQVVQKASWLPQFGPGLIVAAAFVGPGTVTTAAKAGANYGLGLVWVVVFAVVAAIILQEMACRLGTLTGIGLGEMLRRQFKAAAVITTLALLVAAAIGLGNAAYQTGNLIGAAVGISSILNVPISAIVVAIGVVAGGLLWWGSYRLLERVLIAAVAVMGLAFVGAAGVAIAKQGLQWGDLRPVLPTSDLKTVLALIGTTIVPYNLFLHASAAGERWSRVRPRGDGLKLARVDSAWGIGLGGLVTLAIVVAAAAALGGMELENGGDAAKSLESVLGSTGATVAFSVGLASAGLTSAITAPLAAAYALTGVFGWSTKANTWRFRAIWLTVLLAGIGAGVLFGESPNQTIVFAQAANAIVLPVIAVILLMACNAKILGKFANSRLQNGLAILVILVVVLLALRPLL